MSKDMKVILGDLKKTSDLDEGFLLATSVVGTRQIWDVLEDSALGSIFGRITEKDLETIGIVSPHDATSRTAISFATGLTDANARVKAVDVAH